MNAITHIVVNFFLGIFLHLIGLINSIEYFILFVLFGVLIDIDHIFFYIISQHTLSKNKLIKVLMDDRKKMQAGVFIFHSPEFNILVLTLVLFYYHPIFLLIFISNVVHVFLDALEHYRYHKNFHWIKKWSIVF
jgi:hypothetical protein